MANNELLREIGHVIVGAYYDYQDIRTATMNRLRDLIRRKNEGIPLNAVEPKKEKKKFDKKYADENLPKLLKQMLDEKKITADEYEYINKLLDIVNESKKYEKDHIKFMHEWIENEPLYTKWLSKIKGIGPVLSANLIHYFGYCDAEKDGKDLVPHISSLWKYAGMHVENGKAPRKEKGKKVNFNIKARALVWKIGDSFIKQRVQPYRSIYDNEKKRQLELMKMKAPNAPVSLLNAELRARRKMMKVFLAHYWIVARTIAGKPITEPYAQEKLGHTHIIPPPFW